MDVPMHFYQLVFISILSMACRSLPERFLGEPPQNLQMESYNFQHILSWQAKSDPTMPTYYRVLYTDRRSWKTAKQCSNITQLSCNLTDDFKQVNTQYSALVQSCVGNEEFNSPVLHFVPVTDTFLGPPEVNISSCLNCINVTIKLPTSYLRENEKLLSLIDIYQELDYDITLKTLDGEHKRPREKTTEDVFNTVIEELYPNRNYCVSVMVTASLNKHSIPSAWKCVTADSVAQQDYHTVVITCAVCFSLMLAGALKCMHAGGYILQNKLLPRTLVFIRRLAYPPWTFESEKIASIEIIYKEVKKKANESSGDVSDEDESDDSDVISNHDYTRRDILNRVPHSSGMPDASVQYSTNSVCDDSSSQASENPGTDPEDVEEQELGIEEDKVTSRELLNPFSEANCNYSSRPRDSACFTINLKTVLLGTSEENVDSSAALLSSQEDAADWQCTHAVEAKLLDDTESVQKPHCHNDSHEWQNSSPSSDESDLSDSDMYPKNEYIRR
ncbi:interferon alpha/beta receptor 2 [Strigops habroptila]|uniref:Interferon alpha and beta receptor subunit 2 n=1 Tax=Strigops habroptila TaxID=2489341 RepID=A0A672THW1_STRHB|nr:interferon alpha/beta receptor 2 [Strigops habroptila]XP_030332108.1 interferon alpha/beta receptor 2 [Strigops habroptila]XP_030332109.1 interferon alpha/beta receptor 2 [Strigops habroptila]